MFALKRKRKANKTEKHFLLSLCVLIVAVAMVSVSLTLALIKVKNPYTTNVATIGEVKIKLIDQYYDEDVASNGQNYNETDPPVFGPKTTVHKTVKVKNTGNVNCYVRLKVCKDWTYQSGTTQAILTEYISWEIDDHWVEGVDLDDGYTYYYYKTPLDAGDTTFGLFKNNVFKILNYPTEFGGNNSIGHIIVKAQAVQSDCINSDDLGPKGDLTSSKTFVRNAAGNIVKWNGLEFREVL